jgi:hypothetical protein
LPDRPLADRPLADRPLADLVFTVALVVAGPVILALNREQWFFLDEWSFLLERDATSLTSVISPHWGHCVVLPVLVYRGLFALVGLDSYLPYQLPVVAAHLGLAAVLRTLLRRAGVEPGLATAAGIVFLFLGSGRSNLAWGFQITLTGSLLSGFGALALLAPRTDRPDRPDGPDTPDTTDRTRARTVGAAALLVVSVLCSNVGMVMVGIVGAAAFLLGGWRRAAAIAAPAIVVLGLWGLFAPVSERSVESADPANALRFAWRAAGGALGGLTTWWPLTVATVALAAVGVVGMAAGASGLRGRLRPELVVPVVLALAAPATALALGRARGVADEQAPTASRYVYLLVALGLVPLVVLLQEAVRHAARGRLAPHQRRLQGAVVVLVLAWLPVNLARVGPTTDAERARLGSELQMIYLAEMADVLDLPAGDELQPGITVGALAELRATGELPHPPSGVDDQVLRDRAEITAVLRITEREPLGCEPLDPTVPADLLPGEVLVAPGPQEVTLLGPDGPGGSVLWLTETRGTEVVEVHRPIRVRIDPLDGPDQAVSRCDGVPAGG